MVYLEKKKFLNFIGDIFSKKKVHRNGRGKIRIALLIFLYNNF